MSDFNVKNWFENILWLTYPRDLCNRIGSKSLALTSTLKKVSTVEQAEAVIAGLREQIRYFRKLKNAGKHESKWLLGMLSTWMNQERWTDEIPSHYELQKTQEPDLCKCGAIVHVGQLCLTCYDKVPRDDWRVKMMREYFIKNKLGQKVNEPKEQWILRLRRTAKINAKKIGVI